ncbi:phosphotransferase family protein [Falsiroseomonas tokyonensis]|uniref:Phosphotransferase family protein n=1 Tax=Falsiroseomonas tokyonensis TaxID=430521 RepID=A0ABV7C4X4_9PROT|nr:aminoglycoside phosphotransferase family protein [Falsiroseomonas tokyonensis]MBU8541212.1 aminoglycoside phosphotransferase family protein [Falsiroseomonas tokyonensis]
MEAGLEALRATILAAFPNLSDARFVLIADGWESQAVDVDDRLIFRFPRFERGIAALEREARLLAVIAPMVPLAVPRTHFHPGPPCFAWHAKLPGGTLLPAGYAALPEAARQRLAEDLAGFQVALHGLDPAPLRQAGIGPVWDWPAPDSILHEALPRLPPELRSAATRLAADCAALPPDPAGIVFGHFDTHGWNLAFDHAAGRLHGVFDFGSSGFGPRHRDFLAPSFIAPDLTVRMMAQYEALTGLRLDRDRIALLTGLQRLMEFGESTDAQIVEFGLLRNLQEWIPHLP